MRFCADEDNPTEAYTDLEGLRLRWGRDPKPQKLHDLWNMAVDRQSRYCTVCV